MVQVHAERPRVEARTHGANTARDLHTEMRGRNDVRVFIASRETARICPISASRRTGLHDDLVGRGLGEFRIRLGVVVRPIHFGMSGRGMSLGIQHKIVALLGVCQDVPAHPAQHNDGVATGVPVILGDQSFHPEATMDAGLRFGVDQIQILLGLAVIERERARKQQWGTKQGGKG